MPEAPERIFSLISSQPISDTDVQILLGHRPNLVAIEVLKINGGFLIDLNSPEAAHADQLMRETKDLRKIFNGGLDDCGMARLTKFLRQNHMIPQLKEIDLSFNQFGNQALIDLLTSLPIQPLKLKIDYSINCDSDLHSHITRALAQNPELELSFSCKDLVVKNKQITIIAPENMEWPQLKERYQNPPSNVTLAIPANNFTHHDFDDALAHFKNTPIKLVFENADKLGIEVIASWFKAMKDNPNLVVEAHGKFLDIDKTHPSLAAEMARMSSERIFQQGPPLPPR